MTDRNSAIDVLDLVRSHMSFSTGPREISVRLPYPLQDNLPKPSEVISALAELGAEGVEAFDATDLDEEGRSPRLEDPSTLVIPIIAIRGGDKVKAAMGISS